MPSLLSHHQSPHPRMSFRLLLILYLKSVRESQRGNICIYKPINCKCFEGLIILISIGRKGKSRFSIYTFTLKKSCEAASSTPPVPRTPSCWLRVTLWAAAVTQGFKSHLKINLVLGQTWKMIWFAVFPPFHPFPVCLFFVVWIFKKYTLGYICCRYCLI